MKKLWILLLCIIIIGCAQNAPDTGSPNNNSNQNENYTVKVFWEGQANRAADATEENKIQVTFFKVPIEDDRYVYSKRQEIDQFEISPGDILNRDYRDKVPEGYMLAFYAKDYVMVSKANDGYFHNGQPIDTFFELKFETADDGTTYATTLLGTSIEDEKLYDLPKEGWEEGDSILDATGQNPERQFYLNNQYLMGYYENQAMVYCYPLFGKGYLTYWFMKPNADGYLVYGGEEYQNQIVRAKTKFKELTGIDLDAVKNPDDDPNVIPDDDPADNPNDNPSDTPDDEPNDTPSETTGDDPNDNPSDTTGDDPNDNLSDTPNDDPNGNPNDNPDDPNANPSDNSEDNPDTNPYYDLNQTNTNPRILNRPNETQGIYRLMGKLTSLRNANVDSIITIKNQTEQTLDGAAGLAILTRNSKKTYDFLIVGLQNNKGTIRSYVSYYCNITKEAFTAGIFGAQSGPQAFNPDTTNSYEIAILTYQNSVQAMSDFSLDENGELKIGLSFKVKEDGSIDVIFKKDCQIDEETGAVTGGTTVHTINVTQKITGTAFTQASKSLYGYALIQPNKTLNAEYYYAP